VKISDFDKRVLIEQIRYLEMEHTLAGDAVEVANDLSIHSDFEERLWLRARRLVEHNSLSMLLEHAARLTSHVKTAALIIAAVLGMLGVVYAVTDSSTINIYWLLLILLGFNFLSMLLWLTGISLDMKGLAAGVLSRLTGWQPGRVNSNDEPASDITGKQAEKLAGRAWLVCHFTGAVGKWQFSKISHQLWLVYLLAGLGCLVLLLMVRQYDFVWGTTLLSDTAFVKLTEILSAPLQALGFATPSADQVQDTRIGLTQVLNIEYRTRWAQFLMGALLCFGILPRVLLWSWAALMCIYARRRFTLDYYLPYYISLRQQLMPLASHGQIIDADASPPVISKIPASTLSRTPALHRLPEVTLWVAVELDENISWPPVSISADKNLGQVVDRDSLASILQQLQRNPSPVLAVAVSSARLPDRGVQRTISSLVSSSEQPWLVLLQRHDKESIPGARLAAWYRLAEACKVSADHVISMSLA